MAKKVLIVDDVAFVRKTLTSILLEGHYQIVGEAVDGNDAIEKYQKLRPDLVTMDVVMPEMSGIEATKRIMKMDKNARVVIITAMGQENLVMEAINVGARDYILKPFSAQDVLKTVERALLSDDRSASRPTREQKL
ncbi:response regulator [bacterium]|jgi:two-component system chemotaxis response regulator CheY|nr:response regulator [bacterium]